MEIHEVVKAKLIKDYVIELLFDNKKKGRVDLKKYLGRGMFRNLLDKKKFKQFRVDSELGTICWPNGADIAPDTLYMDVVGRN